MPKLASPLKVALIVWEPALKLLVENVATPPERVAVPSVAAPSLKVTRSPSAGVPAPGRLALTLAVKVAVLPKFTPPTGDAVTLTVVLAGDTRKLASTPLLPARLMSPANAALMLCVVTARPL